MDATRSVDEVFVDVCAIFGDLPKLEKKRRKKGKDFFLTLVRVKENEKKNIARFMHQSGFQLCLVKCPSDTTTINNVERFSIERLKTYIAVITAANQNKGIPQEANENSKYIRVTRFKRRKTRVMIG